MSYNPILIRFLYYFNLLVNAYQYDCLVKIFFPDRLIMIAVVNSVNEDQPYIVSLLLGFKKLCKILLNINKF